MEQEGPCVVEISAHPERQAGVWGFHFQVIEPDIFSGKLAKVASIVATFPSANNATLAGFLLAKMVQLGSMYERFRADPSRAPKKELEV